MSKNKVSSSQSNSPLKYPAKFLRPIGEFLKNQLANLEKRRTSLDKDDPFSAGRADSNASPDAGAAEQFGRARVEALKHEIDRKIIQIRKALTRVKFGTYGICEDCGLMIDTDRLIIFPGATLCVSCERKREKKK